MSDKELNQKESLELITEMIHRAKSNYQKGGSFYFLLWGWVITSANFGQYILAEYFEYPYHYIVWFATIPAAIISAVYGFRQGKKAIVTSHFDRLYGQLWLAIGIGIVIILVFMADLSFNHGAIILLFAGIGTYMSGRLLKFNPLVFGGFALEIASIISFNVSPIDQTLVGGIAIFIGYIIPGYLLKRQEK